MTRWQFNRTFYGDPDSHTPSEVTGHQDHHVELAEFVDQHGNTKIERVEEHSNPGALAGPWELIDTYYGDPETGTSHEATGRKPFHRRLGRYINPHGKTKTEVLNEDEHDQSWQEQKREYKQDIAEKQRKREQAQQRAAAATATHADDSLSLAALNGATLTYENADGTTETVTFDDTTDE